MFRLSGSTQAFRLANFRDVDASGDSSAYVGFLDDFAAKFGHIIDVGIDLLDLRPGSSVLDVGCGHGAIIPALAARVGSTGRVMGIDVSRELVTEAHRRLAGQSSQVAIRVGDAQAIDIADASYDAVRADRVLIFVPDPGHAVREIARVTRPGGRVVITEADLGASILDSADRHITSEVLARVAQQFPNPWIGRQLRGLFVHAGLTDLQVRWFATPTTSLADWSTKFGVREAMDAAVVSGQVSADGAETWFEALRERDAAGRFLAASILCMVRGTKPSVSPDTATERHVA